MKFVNPVAETKLMPFITLVLLLVAAGKLIPFKVLVLLVLVALVKATLTPLTVVAVTPVFPLVILNVVAEDAAVLEKFWVIVPVPEASVND